MPLLDADDEPAVAAILSFANGAIGTVVPVGTRDKLIIRAEIIGSEGRLIVDEPRGTLALERFTDSTRYAGYRELTPDRRLKRQTLSEMSPFVSVARDIANGVAPACSADDALAGMRILATMAAA